MLAVDLVDLLRSSLLVLPYVLAVVSALAFVVLMVVLCRNPLPAVLLVLIVTVWDAAAYGLTAIHLGIAIYPQDIVFGCVGLAAFLRLAFVPETKHGVPRPLLVLVCVMAGSFVVGLYSHGTAAGVEFRNDFYFWAACLYIVTFRPDRRWLDRLLTFWIAATLMLCVVVWYRWTADALGLDWFSPIWRHADPTGVDFNRVAPSSVAFALGLAALVSIVSLVSRERSSGIYFFVLPALLLTILLLQHRSVWVATLMPMLLLLALHGGRRPSDSRRALLATCAAIAIISVALGTGVMRGVTESVATQAVRATSTTDGTFVARVDGWKVLVGDWARSGPVGLAVGRPYGSGYERHQGSQWGGVLVTYSPHNYYVIVLLRTGLIGLLALALLFWRLAAAGLSREESNERFGPALIAAITLCVMLYCIPYGPTAASGLLMGAALSVAQWRRMTTSDLPVTAHAGGGAAPAGELQTHPGRSSQQSARNSQP
jgi:hypothetical protein